MSILMNKEKMQALANELAKEIKTPEDLTQLSAMLTKMTVEAALKSELDQSLLTTVVHITHIDVLLHLLGWTTSFLRGFC